MIDSLYIAWRYVSFNKAKTASERQLMSRAVTTPLVVGAKGSALDLVMNTLYFGDEVPELIAMEASGRVMETDLALPIPVYVRFRARGYAIVGTTLDYFEFRGLKVAEGRQIAVLGDCVVGANVAEKLNLKPGETLISSPETLFDLAGVYPLKMKVTGVLEKSHTSDDLAIFVDIKTAWVIQGLGHGHQDVTVLKDPTLVLRRTKDNVAATAKLYHYMEITDENIDSFHFHGDITGYPITAVIVVPYDAKSGTILQGRYLSKAETLQIVKPEDVIDGLLQNIFRIKNVLDAVISVVALATVMAIVLVFALSLRLRQREIETVFKLGCSRMTIARLVASEIFIIVFIGGVFCSVMVFLVDQFSNDLVRALFIR
jgi:putative ABC transport system permease protein